jgi:uncharacterized SAM-binding protein YcdF (DUF218 family)
MDIKIKELSLQEFLYLHQGVLDQMVSCNSGKLLDIDARLLYGKTWTDTPELATALITEMASNPSSELSVLANDFIRLTTVQQKPITQQLPSSELILVLGSVLDIQGKPSAELIGRLSLSLSLYKHNPYSLFLLSGGAAKNGLTEAAVMQNWLIERGVPQKNIVLEDSSMDTVDNVKYSTSILLNLGITSISLVTGSGHMNRASTLLKAFFFKNDVSIDIQQHPNGFPIQNESNIQHEKFLLFKDLGRVLGVWEYQNYDNPIQQNQSTLAPTQNSPSSISIKTN